MKELSAYQVNEAPEVVYYIKDFLTPAEEHKLWTCVYGAPKPKWTVLSHRRLQNWGGLPHEKGMVAETLPQWLAELTERVSALGIFGAAAANHVLVNEYLPGQGIMAHEDGPLFYPTVCTANLGSHTLLNLYGSPDTQARTAQGLHERYLGSLLLEPRSLLILQERAYTSCMHDISADALLDLVSENRILNWSKTALGRQDTVFWDHVKENGINSEEYLTFPSDENGPLLGGDCSIKDKESCPKTPSNVTHEEILTERATKTGYCELRPGNVGNCWLTSKQILGDDYHTLEEELFKLIGRLNTRLDDRNMSQNQTSAHTLVTNNFDISDSEDLSKNEVVENEFSVASAEINEKSIESNNYLPHASNDKDSLRDSGSNGCQVGNRNMPSPNCDKSISSFVSLVGPAKCDHTRALLTAAGGPLTAQTLDERAGLSGCGTGGRSVVIGTLGINEKAFILQRGTRVSLTIRRVPKVMKTKLFLGRK